MKICWKVMIHSFIHVLLAANFYATSSLTEKWLIDLDRNFKVVQVVKKEKKSKAL